MTTNRRAFHLLTLQEVETRQQQLDYETQADQIALHLGLIKESDLIEHTIYREFEQRWLEMEALLLKNQNSFIH